MSNLIEKLLDAFVFLQLEIYKTGSDNTISDNSGIENDIVFITETNNIPNIANNLIKFFGNLDLKMLHNLFILLDEECIKISPGKNMKDINNLEKSAWFEMLNALCQATNFVKSKIHDQNERILELRATDKQYDKNCEEQLRFLNVEINFLASAIENLKLNVDYANRTSLISQYIAQILENKDFTDNLDEKALSQVKRLKLTENKSEYNSTKEQVMLSSEEKEKKFKDMFECLKKVDVDIQKQILCHLLVNYE
ncbi:hypothetical protein EDEG_03299 [Edhazardia aedis USNM 41457]|uniref:Uncharacterized protein n=1 Tax=Edhazardia aedis (strain USNM 41457) TaxID=1003232 RepID=J9DLM3_EDHAE|nr:hypothetical protein EDEG_03299 [Edhazardia aedis USNM 41457]|eukprot:EJW02262.1 hypothetical protein EDEG_03299 [Edhazardia aedis USNM 41457]